jgi:alkylated DNA repair protein alkB family protein 8
MQPATQQLPVATAAEETGIPGLQLLLNFVTPEEEQQLLDHIDKAPWTSLAKRRVQHYGYTFEYSQRSINPEQGLGELPGFVQTVVQRVQVRQDMDCMRRSSVACLHWTET